MNASELKRISKSMSYVLRHRPESIGIQLGSAGWIEVEELLRAFARHGKRFSRETIERVVAENDKNRFEFDDDGTKIRARHGHSVEINLAYQPAVPPEVLCHGTAEHNLASIFELGLTRGSRHHVHISTDKETMLAVANRHGKPVLLAVDAAWMDTDGYEFYVTGNDVWLTESVAPHYLKVVDDATAGPGKSAQSF